MQLKHNMVLSIIGLLCLSACCGTGSYEVKLHDGKIVQLPYCKSLIEYSGNSFSIKGLSIPIPSGTTPVTIGNVTWDSKTLQQASQLSQILDIHRMQLCQSLPTIVTVIYDQKKIEEIFLNMYEEEAKITQLAILIQANNPKAVEKWISTYGTTTTTTSARQGFLALKGEKIEKIERKEIKSIPLNDLLGTKDQ